MKATLDVKAKCVGEGMKTISLKILTIRRTQAREANRSAVCEATRGLGELGVRVRSVSPKPQPRKSRGGWGA